MIGLLLVILLRGAMTQTDVYAAFLTGAERGMKSALSLLPALSGMLLMLGMMNASGLTAFLVRIASPAMDALNLPGEAAPLLLLRPLTGSGSLAALEQVFACCGPDSRAGRIASIVMGAGETVLYTMTVYGSAAGVKRLPGVLPASLVAYGVGVCACGLLIS